MSAMVSMQMEGPPSASDVASDLVSSLDTDGDGEVSAEEITAAFSAAGLNTNGITSALGEIDTDASGKLSVSELTTAVSSDMEAHRPSGPPPGGRPPGGPPPSPDEAATSLVDLFDTDDDSSLSQDEVLKALGLDSDADGSVGSAFASLDSDGDGLISTAELSAAIQQNMDAGYRAYAQQASATA